MPAAAIGMGVAVGDYDGDGFPDLYVTQYGRSILYHNNGDGTFTDVTEKAGVAAPGWTSSAVWFDYDNDGRLDLFVCQFRRFRQVRTKFCGDADNGRAPATAFRASSSRCPAGCFTTTATAPLPMSARSRESPSIWAKHGAWSPRISTTTAGWTSSSPTTPWRIFCLLNRGKGKFEEIGLLAGRGLQRRRAGRAPAWEWIPPTSTRTVGWICLSPTSTTRCFSLYQNNHDETFDDLARCRWASASATRLMSGWGLKFFDYDNDGNLDLILANGHPDDLIDELYPRGHLQGAAAAVPQHGQGVSRTSARRAARFSRSRSPRAAWPSATSTMTALVDVLISVNDGAPLLLRNNVGKAESLAGSEPGRQEMQSRRRRRTLTYQAGDLKRSRMKVGGGSYLVLARSAHGARHRARPQDRLAGSEWPQPSGAVERFTDLPLDRYITIVEGEGKWK